ncbi:MULTISPECIES: DUF7882 family protein [unclassified Leifsonia]|uniref:DUF7882 family protein n=1 Tax=unclassified Leifsonia TaxID=2663824 RepID=UPI0006F5DC4B|nr:MULTISPECIES: hypothetical protein [unclassified Leifsonia]KQX07659.1 hypothetical protein ASC59_07980 [Leifsonia sp. Root1293]KRA11941.1 hypothetical protein ASD61_07980 [Leifsonia sp. Root60]
MGRFIHPAVGAVWFHDRVLAHLQIVISSKLRVGEGFFLTWHDHEAPGIVASSVWIDASIPIGFTYERTARPDINESWLDVLKESASSNAGLILTDEVRAEIRGDAPDRFSYLEPGHAG